MLNKLLISLPMMVCFFWSIFFLVRIWKGEDEPRVRRAILLFYLASTVLYTGHWLFFSAIRSSLGAYLYMLANLSVYPLYYAYLRALTRTRNIIEIGCLFIPTMVMAILSPLNANFGWLEQEYLITFTRCCFAAQVLWVWIRGYQILRSTRRRMDNTYSDDRGYLLQPTYVMQHLLGITAFFSTLLNIVGREFFVQEAPVAIPAIVMSGLLFGIGYVAAHTVVPKETVAPEEEKNEDEEATTEETDQLMNEIATALREQKLFANPKLTIQDLATAIHSNRTYVSNCINRRTGLSFSQYIARYRVENAIAILRDDTYKTDHEAFEAAMVRSGFSSDQNFYRLFKDITGKTPLQYRKERK